MLYNELIERTAELLPNEVTFKYETRDRAFTNGTYSVVFNGLTTKISHDAAWEWCQVMSDDVPHTAIFAFIKSLVTECNY